MTNLTIDDIWQSNLKAVVFDLDGTLYDKRRLPMWLILTDIRHVRYLASERIARRKLKGQYFGNPDAFYQSLFTSISDRIHVPYHKVKKWYLQQYMPQTARVLKEHYKIGDFVEPLLTELKSRGVKVAVFSDYRYVENKLRALGLDPNIFDYVLAATEMGGLKPNKTLFEKVLQTLDVRPEDALMIGDRLDTDGQGAEAVGMRYLKV